MLARQGLSTIFAAAGNLNLGHLIEGPMGQWLPVSTGTITGDSIHLVEILQVISRKLLAMIFLGILLEIFRTASWKTQQR